MSNLIVMAWILSFGFVPNSSLKTSGGSMEASNCLIQTLGMGFYLADHIHIYSTVQIRETKTHDVYFDPFRGDYLIGGSFRFKNFSIGVSHECNHDIVTNTKLHKYNGWEAAFEQVYVNYTIPIRINSKTTIIPSITLSDQFTETVRIKSNDKKKYFAYLPMDVSPNILSSEFRIEMQFSHARSRMSFQAGYAPRNNKWAYAQFKLGVEMFYKNISLGVDYIKRKNIQKDAGYSLEALGLFVRFRGRSSLL
jgi:hypothetical protein